jgi:predicted small secreted protein
MRKILLLAALLALAACAAACSDLHGTAGGDNEGAAAHVNLLNIKWP